MHDPYYATPSGYVFNISNPAQLQQLGHFPSGTRITLRNGWAFIRTGYPEPITLQAYSVADPHNIWNGGMLAAEVSDMATSGANVYAVATSLGLWVTRFTPPQPVDLAPFNFATAASGAVPGRPLRFVGWVQNLGPSATTHSFQISFVGTPVDRAGPPVNLCNSVRVAGSLASSATINLAAYNRTLYGAEHGVLSGRYRVEVIVDSLNEIAERREHNNTMLSPQLFTVQEFRLAARRAWSLYR
jgi:hypothetical protein